MSSPKPATIDSATLLSYMKRYNVNNRKCSICGQSTWFFGQQLFRLEPVFENVGLMITNQKQFLFLPLICRTCGHLELITANQVKVNPQINMEKMPIGGS